MNDSGANTLSITRTLLAPRNLIWRCWTEEQLLKQWYCPQPWAVTHAELNLHPGGRMNCTMAGPDGEKIEISGCYLEVVPGERLVFTDAFTEGFMPQPNSFMTGVVEFSDTGQGQTKMIWSARHATQEARQQHLEMGFEEGWNTAASQLDVLAQRIASETV